MSWNNDYEYNRYLCLLKGHHKCGCSSCSSHIKHEYDDLWHSKKKKFYNCGYDDGACSHKKHIKKICFYFDD